MPAITVQCSHCGVTLKLKDASKVGKTVPCPKCRKPFVVQAQAPVEEEFDISFDDTEDPAETAAISAPRRAPVAGGGAKSRSTPRKGKSRSSGGGGGAGLWIGLGAVALLVLVGVGLWAAGVFSSGQGQPVAQESAPPAPAGDAVAAAAHVGGPSVTPTAATAPASAPAGSRATSVLSTAWLPDDAELLVHIRVADLLATPLLKNLLANPQVQQQLVQAAEQTGMALGDIDSLTIGLPALTLSMIQTKINKAANGPPLSPEALFESALARGVVVVRTNKPVDAAAVKLDQRGAAASHAGKTYYRIRPPDPSTPAMAVAFVESTLVLGGTEAGVQSALQRGAGSASNPRFGFDDPAAQVLVAFSPHQFEAGVQQLETAGKEVPEAILHLKELHGRGARGGALELSLAGGLKLGATVQAVDPAAAQRIEAEFKALIDQHRAQFTALASQPGGQQMFLGMARPLVDRIATSRDGQLTRVTTSLSDPELQQIGGIATAMLLPAISQTRTAAQRTQSKNNLHELTLALHMHHDVHRSFPSGTHVVPDLTVDERLAWTTDLLPFLEQEPLYKQIDFSQGWNNDRNAAVLRTPMTVFLNPGAPQVVDSEYSVTQYVGLAGLGEDGPTLPATSPRAGVFAYDRPTSLADIRDGSSNTAMLSEASDGFGPWAAGGRPTLRSLTAKPYINGPDGLGGPFEGGVHMSLADGAVRFVSQDIDPKVLEALMTISGGEAADF